MIHNLVKKKEKKILKVKISNILIYGDFLGGKLCRYDTFAGKKGCMIL